MNRRRPAVLLTVALTVALTVVLLASGCAGGTTEEVDRNAVDIQFVQQLLPHHRQGLALIALGEGRVQPQVAMLTAAIASTQTDEVAQMSRWLASWGAPEGDQPGPHGDHEQSPTSLTVRGEEFEARFVELLIAHQDQAIQLARMELGGGINHTARAFADRVVRSRTAQIDLLRGR